MLVGFVLAFVMRSRREMAEFFDAPIPEALDPEGRRIYVADWAIQLAHRRASKFMSEKLAAVFASDEESRGLPLNAFSTPNTRPVASEGEVGAPQRLSFRRGIPVPGH